MLRLVLLSNTLKAMNDLRRSSVLLLFSDLSQLKFTEFYCRLQTLNVAKSVEYNYILILISYNYNN